MNLITRIIEPQRLFLVWQGPGGGSRYIVGELRRTDHAIELHYLTQSDDFKMAEQNGFEGYPAFPKASRVYKDGVIETLVLRLPPRERTDFDKYLESIRISPTLATQISDFALLGYSGAKLPSDGFSIVHPFEDVEEPCELLTEVAGFRYYEGMQMQLSIGMKASLQPEPDNRFDPLAIMVLVKGIKIGYIGRGLLRTFHQWLKNESEITAIIEKMNGRPERPSVMLFISVVPQKHLEHAMTT
jgi:hypothetical protein